MGNKNIKLDQMKILVTSDCNLNCVHCFRAYDKHQYYISHEKLIELIDFALKTSCDSVSFSGGEFFVHPSAYDVLSYCFSKKLKVKILTNAYAISDWNFFEKYRGTDLLSFQVSIDGMKVNHDLRRGTGVFDQVISNVKRLKSYGFNIKSSMTIDQTNMYDVIDVLNIPYFDECNFLPVAFAGEETKQGRPVLNESYRYYEDVIRVIYQSQNGALSEDYRCRMFPHQLGIKYDGTVYPCAVARDYGLFCMGNINEKSISDIVSDYLISDDARELLAYKDNRISECQDCESKNVCNRGCRIRAFKYYGKLLAPDPFCCKLFRHGFDSTPINCIFWGED